MLTFIETLENRVSGVLISILRDPCFVVPILDQGLRSPLTI